MQSYEMLLARENDVMREALAEFDARQTRKARVGRPHLTQQYQPIHSYFHSLFFYARPAEETPECCFS